MRATLCAAAIVLVMVAAWTTTAEGTRGRAPVSAAPPGLLREARPTPAIPAEAPRLLSQTGLYTTGTTVDPRNRSYSPQYPLWSDGAVKRRWIQLPAGSAIDARDDDRWSFPVGTKFWKEFAFDGRRIETRFLWRVREDAWVFASYVWNQEQTDAVLAPADGIRNVTGAGSSARHNIPSLDDCHACHETGNILGFNPLQLSTDRDPLAPHAEALEPDMVTVRTLVDEQRLRPARVDLVASPPRIDAATPVARAALGYLSANCGICHRQGAAIDSALRLRPTATGDARAVLMALTSAPVSWDIPSADEGATRLLNPGHPELSSILARMRSRRPSSQMPPLGTTVVDREATELIANWIREMR